MLLVLTAMNAGPLWRDETNTFNLAHMPSLRDIWHNMQFDSFPLLWPLLVSALGFSLLFGAIVLMRMRAELARNKVEARLKRMAGP